MVTICEFQLSDLCDKYQSVADDVVSPRPSDDGKIVKKIGTTTVTFEVSVTRLKQEITYFEPAPRFRQK